MKFGPFIAMILVTGLLVALLAPGAPDPASQASSGSAHHAGTQLEVMQRDQWLAGEVVLPRAGDGHFYTEVSAEAGSALMLVDTGASVIALTGEDAQTMGVSWNEADLQPVAQGAGGPVLGVPVTLGRVQVGRIELTDVAAVVVPKGLHVSLLGQSFLSQVGRIEVDGDRMSLGG